MRTVELNLDFSKLPDDTLLVQQAIGRLSLWGADTFPVVKIYNDGDNDMLAVYFDNENQRRFVLGAVYRQSSNEFTYHS